MNKTITQQYNEARSKEPGLSFPEFQSRSVLPGGNSTVNEPVTASPTANIVQRDFDKEQATLKKLGVNQSMLGTIDPSTLLEATYSKEELAGMKSYQDLKNLNQAKSDLVATPKPTNSIMGVLDEALRTKTDVGNQPLGKSDLFAKAGLKTTGVSGYATLNASLEQHGQEMQDRYGSFVNQMSKTAGTLNDSFNEVADRYKILNDAYQEESTRMQRITEIMLQHENAMEILQSQSDLKQSSDDLFGDSENIKTSDGNWSDNCILYTRSKVPSLPFGLFTIEDKQKAVNQFGFTNVDEVKIGDAVLTNEGTWGHGAVIMDILDDGTLILDESNYQTGQITEGRRLDPNKSSVLGFVHNTGSNVGFITGGSNGEDMPERDGVRGEGVQDGVVKPSETSDENTVTGSKFNKNIESLIDGMIEGQITETTFRDAIKDYSSSDKIKILAEVSRRKTNTGLTPRDERELIAATAAIGKMVYGTRISETETPRIERLNKLYIEEYGELNRWEVIKEVLGFSPKKNQELGDDLLSIVKQYVEDGLSEFDTIGLSSLLDDDNTQGAINKVEKFVMSKAQKLEEDNYIGESNVVASAKRVEVVEGLINELSLLEYNPIGTFTGTFEGWLGRFKTDKAQKIATKTLGLVKEFANKFMGANMTENELSFYGPLMPNLSDTMDNFSTKLSNLKEDPLLRLNSIRDTYSLPELTNETLLDKKKRVDLYTGGNATESDSSVLVFNAADGQIYSLSKEDADIALKENKENYIVNQ